MAENTGKAKILIVEDEALIAADLAHRLNGQGYTICGQAATGEKGLALVERCQPDLVMMDIVLQGKMDGIETAEVIRDKWGIPVVFLTANTEAYRLERAKLAYPFGYLLKPFLDRDLKITTEMALYVAQMNREKREAEEALIQETVWWKVLVHHSRDGIVVIDQDGKVFEANKMFMDILGYGPEEINDLYVWDWDDQWNREDLLKMIDSVDEEGDHFETRHRRKDGTVLDVEISTNGAVREGKKLIFCVCRNISKRKQAEAALKRSEERLKLAMEFANDGIYDWNVKDETIYFSPVWKRMLGFEDHEIQDEISVWGRLIHPDDKKETCRMLNELIEGKRNRFEKELRMRHKDGQWVDILSRANVVRDSEGKGVRVVGTHVDITDRKKTEEKLKESRARIEAALSSMTDAVIITDADGSLVEFNDAFATFHRFDSKEAFCNVSEGYPDVIDVFFPDGTLAPRDQWAIPRALRGETVVDAEYSLKRKDTGETWVGSYNFSPIYGEGEEIIGAVVIGRDITDRKRTEERIKASLLEKETLLKELNHRVKNNMQVIISLMRLQSEKIGDDQLKSSFLETQNRIYAMSAVHETLHQSDSLASVNLADYLTKLAAITFKTYRTDSGNIHLDTRIPYISIDLERSYPIGLVINELLSNSLKYAFPDGRSGEIRISGELDGNTGKLVVYDSGVGISRNLDWRKTKSLGLQIVHSLIEGQLKGTIDLERDHGTRWIITFPI